MPVRGRIGRYVPDGGAKGGSTGSSAHKRSSYDLRLTQILTRHTHTFRLCLVQLLASGTKLRKPDYKATTTLPLGRRSRERRSGREWRGMLARAGERERASAD